MPTIKMWRVETRPNTGVTFWDLTDADKQYYQTAYKDPNILVSDIYTYTDDQLSRTRTFHWNLITNLIEMIGDDPTLNDMIARNKLYDDVNGITRSDLYFEVYNDGSSTPMSNGSFPHK